MRESTIGKACERLLTKRGAWWIKTHGSGIGRAGIPDYLATYEGHSLVLEAKVPGKKPTRLQQHELDLAAAAGAIAVVITSRDQLEQLLDKLDQEGPRP